MIEDASNELPDRFRLLIQRQLDHLKELDRQVCELEREIEQGHRGSEVCKRLQTIPGIGPITASALVASAGDPRNFKNARQFAAWIGLVPHQNSRVDPAGITLAASVARAQDGSTAIGTARQRDKEPPP